MQSQVINIRQSSETWRFADQAYNSGNNLFTFPAGASRQVLPPVTTSRRSQPSLINGPGRNSINKDATWIRQAE